MVDQDHDHGKQLDRVDKLVLRTQSLPGCFFSQYSKKLK